MKKIFLSLGIVMAATLSLTNCTKQQAETPLDPESEGIPFEVSTILTRTTNDGVGTNWAKNDAINLIHAEAGTKVYVSDGKFEVDAELTGKFKGTLGSELTASTYDWYALYPYESNVKNPESKNAGLTGNSGITTVGAKTQTQNGNNSTGHLCGDACPLYGVVKSVSSSATPTFTMNNLASIVCIEVTNTLATPLTVSTISFTSSEDIVGDYYIDFADSPVVYTAKDGSTSNTVTLNVSGGTAIAKDASAKFYIAIKPHTAPSGSTLKLSVNGSEKSVELGSAKTFEAGKIKTLKIKYESVTAGADLPFTEEFSDSKALTNETTLISETLFKKSFSSNFTSFVQIYRTKTDGVVRFSNTKETGIMVTKALNLSKASKITINAKDYSTDGGTADGAVIKVTIGGKVYTSEILTTEFADYTFKIPAVTSNEVVTITANVEKTRFYVDSIKIDTDTDTGTKSE